MAFLTTVVAWTVSRVKKSETRRNCCIMPFINFPGENGAANTKVGLVEEERRKKKEKKTKKKREGCSNMQTENQCRYAAYLGPGSPAEKGIITDQTGKGEEILRT